MRRHLAFDCSGETLVATLDEAAGHTGLLIVSGGNELRSGAFAGQARLAAEVAAAGFPAFRFDRRGIGDSSGQNEGFTESSSDVAAALMAFRAACPAMSRVLAFGNCDAAAALMLTGGSGFDALLLANPWTIEDGNDTPPPAAIRARYAQKLKSPAELLRLVSGKVSVPRLARGLWRALRPPPPPTSLARQIALGLSGFDGPVRIALAGRDRTAQAFLATWDRADPRLRHCSGASHAFMEDHAAAWLRDEILDMLHHADVARGS